MARYLVVANQTLAGDRLMEEIRRRLAAGPSSFYVLVPAILIPVNSIAGPYLQPAGEDPFSSAPAPAIEAAQHRVDLATESRLAQLLRQIKAAGGKAEGKIGDPDAVKAIGALLATTEEFDEIIISTLPQGLSRWLRLDVPHRVERKFKLPVTSVTGKA
jgi:hypothetical protein